LNLLFQLLSATPTPDETPAPAGPSFVDLITNPITQLGLAGSVILALAWFGLRAYNREADRADKATEALAELNKEVRDSPDVSSEDYRAAVARADKANAELAELNREVRDKIVPAVVDFARTASALLDRIDRDRR
jgi:hypothetical protein